VVLIFSEGLCKNEWHLRPLKKGTARLALSAWEDGIPLKILPVGINYQSFSSFGKNIQLFLGEPITQNDFPGHMLYGKKIGLFNETLKNRLQELVLEIDINDKTKLQQAFFIQQSVLKKVILFIPALLGWFFHGPLYFLIVKAVNKLNTDEAHYDSVITGCLFISYPFYLVLITWGLNLFTDSYCWLFLFFLLPFLAWACVQVKKQF
jgi:1-acyl-sn-glycerol-3-phosphate acyltransferase